MHHDRDTAIRARDLLVAREFSGWLRDGGADALVDAADLLGGPPWRDRAARVARCIGEGDDPTGHLISLRLLHRLLWLDHTDDLTSIEAMRFMNTDPDDPRADEARLVAEALDRALPSLARLAVGLVDREAA